MTYLRNSEGSFHSATTSCNFLADAIRGRGSPSSLEGNCSFRVNGVLVTPYSVERLVIISKSNGTLYENPTVIVRLRTVLQEDGFVKATSTQDILFVGIVQCFEVRLEVVHGNDLHEGRAVAKQSLRFE